MPSSYESFYRYTSGRWLRDEERQLALRYQRFDVEALKRAVLDCTGAKSVLDIRKLPEGRCNKVFLVELDNSRTVIARIPTPIAGPPHLVTASEVATIHFLRNRLGLKQVPRVLAWSSRASGTAVGAEYIIMETAVGVALDNVWDDLPMEMKLSVVYEWAKFEEPVIQAFSESACYGSLYYRADLSPDDGKTHDVITNGVKDNTFVIGPSLETRLWSKDDHCHLLDVDRGSWPDVAAYLDSIIETQRAWIKRFASPPKICTPFDLPPSLQQPAAHLRLLDQLQDSNPNNIFLSQDALNRGKIEISAVIDWQHTAILPLYLQAQFPLFVSNWKPTGQDPDLEQFQKEHDYLRMAYHTLYQDGGLNNAWSSALGYGLRIRPAASVLHLLAATCWEGGYGHLKGKLMNVARDWHTAMMIAPDDPCPLEFSEEELARQSEEMRAFAEVHAYREDAQSKLGITIENWVDHDTYDRAVEANRELRNGWLATLNAAELDSGLPDHWPYRPF
ncbi:hypothetical protein EXIGLDRAFT_780623 [Exidia glandulosa HHB12029]|uniref:Altered inheritance of mitochondria protein 9, mitochondrial n=1 Tax=Exidia glandulosa HHB12029 TaxID=1314781 RepID=A0A165BIK0_EXIGL|nr:hypothetical protein EXIGLDRAFT_780623 [Exidia glandulosa HHB12029]